MTKNAKTVSLAAIGAVVLLLLVFAGRDVLLGHGSIDCADGRRGKIDIRDFATQSSAYALELEASVKDTVRISTKMTPVQLQQLTESLQSANEFRKFVIAGYNSCLITKQQYLEDERRFRAMDSLAKVINELAGRASLSDGERRQLADLIAEYGITARKLGAE
jgi:hypothetical protein